MRDDSNYFRYQLHKINKIYKNKVGNYKITFAYLWLERWKALIVSWNWNNTINLEVICTKLQNNFDLLMTYQVQGSETISKLELKSLVEN